MPLYSPTVPLPFPYRSHTERCQYRHGSRWGDGTIGNNPSPLRGSHTAPHLPLLGLRPRLLSVAPTGLPYRTAPSPRAYAHGYFPSPLRGSHTTPHLPHGLAPTATFRRPYGAPIPHRTFPVGLRPRLLSVAPTGLLYHTAPSPWACAHGYFPSPLRGSHTAPHLPRGLTPTATFRRPYGAPIPHRTLPRGLTPSATFRRPYGAPHSLPHPQTHNP